MCENMLINKVDNEKNPYSLLEDLPQFPWQN